MTRPACIALLVSLLGAVAALLPADAPLMIPHESTASGGYYPPGEEAPYNRFRYVGTSSCSSTDCHHSGGPPGYVSSAYTTWGRVDPHRKAYSVLFEARSKTIQKNRHTTTLAQHDGLCLKCHALNAPESRQGIPGSCDENLRVDKNDGVGCESCHGPAEKWLRAHVQVGWKGLSREQKAEQYGFAPTDDLTYRVRMCSSCHVGRDQGMEVNHVLIAAGHPRLMFEYSGYHNIYPRHWRETEYGPDFEARAWSIGQMETAKAAMDLLAVRASVADAQIKADPEGKSDTQVEWPELSEYDCYACHNGLANPEWQRLPKVPGHKLGTMVWGTWYTPLYQGKRPVATTLLPGLTDGLPQALGAGDTEFAPSVDGLRKEMELARPRPDKVVLLASLLAKQYGDAANRLQRQADADARAGRSVDVTRTKQALTSLIDAALPNEAGGSLRLPGFDQTTQHWLAVASMYHGTKEQRGLTTELPTDELVRKLGQPLRYPRPGLSAIGNAVYIDSPDPKFTPEDYRKALETLRQALDK